MSDNEILDYIVLTFAENFTSKQAFKGGYMLNKLLKEESRLTHDVDLSINTKEDYKEVKSILEKIGESLKEKKIIEKYQIKDNIKPTMSGGMRMYKSNGAVLGVDVGLHDISYGVMRYKLDITDLIGFRIERMLSDKIHAVFTTRRFRRTKDLYDIYVLINNFNVSYNTLVECIDRRGELDWTNSPFKENVLVEYESAWNKLQLVSSVTKKELDKPNFNIVIGLFSKLVFELGINSDKKYWSCEELRWVK